MDPLDAAIRRQLNGEDGAVATYLRANRLTDEDQVTLARFLDGDMKPPPRSRGQPKKNARGAAEIALRFYDEWKDLNRRLAVPDHGNAEAMRTEAVRFITEDFLSRSYGLACEEQQLTIIGYMAKGKSRQN